MANPIPTDSRIEKLSLKQHSIDGYKLMGDNGAPIPVGKGGSGIVFKAKQTLYKDATVTRAIKFFLFSDDILQANPEREQVSNENFLSEIVNVATFNHQSLITQVSEFKLTQKISVNPYFQA